MIQYLLGIGGIFYGDQWIKEKIEKTRKINEKTPVLDGRITITKHHNKGAVLNLGEEKPKVILGVACITLGYVILLLRQVLEKGNPLVKFGMSLIAGGGISNIYDRFKRGYVVDYFIINSGKLKKVIFNLADICIFAGGFFMIVGEIFAKSK